MTKLSQHVFVYKTVGGASSFTQYINIPFEANKLIINYICYDCDPAENTITLIRCSQLGGIIGAFGERNPTPKAEFILPPQIYQGDFLFEILSTTGALSTVRQDSLVIDLEFVKE